MPLKIDQKEYEAILMALAEFPDGAAISQLMRLDLGYPKRTLQRRIDHLVDTGKLVPSGEGRARKYLLPQETIAPEPSATTAASSRISAEARKIRDLVTRPVADRNPVSYHTDFLETYEPNRTPYLPEKLCCELAEMGRVGDCDLPAGTYLRQVMDRLIIDLSWNSSRLEGNTYSLLDTERLLEHGESAVGKDAEETQMILNHKAAIEMLAEEAGGIDFNRYTICNLHALLSENLLPDPAAGGRLRSKLIGIGQSVYEPLQVPQQIETYFDMMLEKASAIANPFEQSFFVMVHLPYLQPFEDVNKRVSRLAANIPMIRQNLCPLSFVDVEEDDYIRATLAVYELNRIEYLRDVYAWAYKRSCGRYSVIRQSLGEPDPFRLRYRQQIGVFVQKVVRSKMDKKTAARWIFTEAQHIIPQVDRPRFIEVVETELSSLHMGNSARYRLMQSEFDEWMQGWN